MRQTRVGDFRDLFEWNNVVSLWLGYFSTCLNGPRPVEMKLFGCLLLSITKNNSVHNTSNPLNDPWLENNEPTTSVNVRKVSYPWRKSFFWRLNCLWMREQNSGSTLIVLACMHVSPLEISSCSLLIESHYSQQALA